MSALLDAFDQLPLLLKAFALGLPVVVLMVAGIYLLTPTDGDGDTRKDSAGTQPVRGDTRTQTRLIPAADKPPYQQPGSDLPTDVHVAATRKPAGQDRLTRISRTGMDAQDSAPVAGPDPVQPPPTALVPAVLPPVPGPRVSPGSARPARDPQDPNRETRQQRRERMARLALEQAQRDREAKKRR